MYKTWNIAWLSKTVDSIDINQAEILDGKILRISKIPARNTKL